MVDVGAMKQREKQRQDEETEWAKRSSVRVTEKQESEEVWDA